METQGRIVEIIPLPHHRSRVTIETDASPADIETLLGKALSVVLKVFRKKRSIDSNNYYWVLVGRIASYDRLSRTEVHNRLIAEYGQDSIVDGALEWTAKPADFDWTRCIEGHYKPSGMQVIAINAEDGRRVVDDGEVLDIYWVRRGSSTYNTEEMAILINGAVDECRERGIETLTPDELARMFAEGINAEHKDRGRRDTSRQGEAESNVS